LAPVLAAGAGPVGGASRGQGAVQRLVVHPADHQHAVVGGVLDHGGGQSIGVGLATVREGGGEAGGGHSGGGRGHRARPSSSARSVRSHVNSGSSRPKWPCTEVREEIGRSRSRASMSAAGRRSKTFLTAAAIRWGGT